LFIFIILSLPKHSKMARPKKEPLIEQPAKQPQKVEPRIVENVRAVPSVMPFQVKKDTGTVSVLNKKSGTVFQLTTDRAKKMVAKYPHEFQIL
jgi:hypothetical protein